MPQAAVALAPDLPIYLNLPNENVPTHGTLRKDSKTGMWELDADPQAVILAKRIFPGCAGRGPGHARFQANRRTFGDLAWFLQRWPMKIEDRIQFMLDYKSACDYVHDRQELNKKPLAAAASPIFKGKLKPFQEEGVGFAMVNEKTLLADDMGLGKTVQGLVWMANRDNWPGLIVVPPHLIPNWQNSIRGFLDCHEVDERGRVLQANGKRHPDKAFNPELRYHVIRGKKPYPLPDAQIYLIHYLLLDAWRNALVDKDFTDIVMDEIQELRHSTSQKYAAASLLASEAEGLLGLSGTPIHGYGAEIWNVLNIVEFHCLGDFDSFTREWCNGQGNMQLKEPELLRLHLQREGLMLRRLKSEVLKQLPPKRRVVVPLDSDTHKFNQLIGHAVDLISQARHADTNFKRGRLELEALQETRRITGITKAPAVANFVGTLMESEEPTLLFVHHHAVMDILKEKLARYKPVFITGRENTAEKVQALDDFKSGKTNLAIIALRSASGLDGFQERAKVVVFAELDWSPAVHAQGEDRAHRMGQTGSVLIYYLVSSVGTDMDMQEALGLKVSQFAGLMGDAPETQKDRMLAERTAKKHMRAVLDRLQTLGLKDALTTA